MQTDLRQYLQGEWAFEREIIIRDSKKLYASATGNAVLKPGPDDAEYEESGKVLMAETKQKTSFFRTYRYVFTVEGLDIYFNDTLTGNFSLYQQYVYDETMNVLIAKEIHVCNKDLYEGGFKLLDVHHYIHTSVIKGPHKDFIITTRFAKIVPG